MKNQILSYLPTDHPWRSRIQVYRCVESTNTLAKSMAGDGAPHGTVLIADCQTGGRGRLGRSFLSPAGAGIYMSVILRPACRPEQLMHLTCACAVAICNAVEQVIGIRPGIKWTNDLVMNSRKVAGILTELSFHQASSVDFAVVGIGINCNQRICDFPPELQSMAGSLASVTGTDISRPRLAAAMISALEKMDQTLLTRIPLTMEHYRQDCITLGKEISVIRDGMPRHGTAVSVDEKGALLVAFSDGTLETVNSGEVSIRGLYGYL